MIKNIVMSSLIAAFSFFSGLFFGNFYYEHKTGTDVVQTRYTEQNELYMLKLTGEKIFMYQFNNDDWEVSFEVTDIEIPALRDEDYQKLKDGIKTSEKEQILHIIEDLSV